MTIIMRHPAIIAKLIMEADFERLNPLHAIALAYILLYHVEVLYISRQFLR